MHILHLTSHLNVGGIASYVRSLSTALAARGHRVTVASGGGQLEVELAQRGVSHWQMPLATSVELSPQVWLAARRLTTRLREEPVDLFHAHTRVGQVVADRLARRLRVPYVTTWHGFYRQNVGRRLWPCTGDRTIAISEPVRQHLVRIFRVPASRVRLIPHGIDPAPFESPVAAAEREALRARLGLPANGPVIGTVARLVASKGVDQLIRSLPGIRVQMPTARVLIVGDGEERSRLRALAASLGVQDAIHFAGSLAGTRVALSLMDVFVFLPATAEGFGLSLLEAMASGRPIVAVRRGGGASWVLEETGVGMLVEPDDVKALGSAVVRYLQDGEAACRDAGRGRAVLRDRFSLARMVEQVEGVYRELVRPG